MLINLINNQFDQLLYNSVAIHPLQSWEWGQARQATGVEVVRLGEYDNKKLINVYQLTLHKLPMIHYQIGYLPRSVAPSKQFLEFLVEFARQKNIIFVKIEPYLLKRDVSQVARLFPTKYLQPSPHPLFPDWTQLIDLKKTEAELLASMHPKTRYNIRLAERKGVTVKEESTDRGYAIFEKLYFSTCRRQRYYGHTPRYHQLIWQNLKNSIAHILIAYYQNQPLAAYELFYFHKRLYYPYGGSAEKNRNVMATNLLMWEAIKLGQRLGAEVFDLWGSLPPDYSINHPWAGFTRFKEGYGGEFSHFVGSYDLVTNQSLYKLYNQIHYWRNIYLKLKAI